MKERAIYRRERMVNLRLDAYLFSRLLPLMLLTAVQVAFMLATVWLMYQFVVKLFDRRRRSEPLQIRRP